MYFWLFLFVVRVRDVFANHPLNDSLVPTVWVDTPKIYHIKLEDLPSPNVTEGEPNNPPKISYDTSGKSLRTPRGFRVNVFADNFVHGKQETSCFGDLNCFGPRWLQQTPDGNVLVVEIPTTTIKLLKDTDGDGVADNITVFADKSNGLKDYTFGMAFAKKDGYFFVASEFEVRRYSYRPEQDRIEGTGTKVLDLTVRSSDKPYHNHWTRNVRVSSREKKIYVTIGSMDNIVSRTGNINPHPYSCIIRANFDGTDNETYACGLRNPVGLEFHPKTRKLYAVVNERDNYGPDLVPDYFTRVRKNAFYGWPYAYLSAKFPDPMVAKSGKQRPDLVNNTRTPDVLFQAHSAALGLAFYKHKKFTTPYQNGAYVAMRGSWNRDQGTGYKIVFVPFGNDNRPNGTYIDFVDGFLVEPQVPRTWGRPVGVLMHKDGSLLFTDEANGRIYRVDYVGTD